MSVTIIADAFKDFEVYLERAPDITLTAARIAINDTISGKGRALIKDAILRQVDFQPSYIDSRRLYVKRKAYNAKLEAVLAARARPTSLARFARGQPYATTRAKKQGLRVMVKPGHSRQMKNAFLIRLRRGAELTDENFNLGLAIRLKPGEQIRNKKVPFDAGGNLHILYGPSIEQVMSEAAEQETPDVLKEVETEFYRQFARLSGA